LIAPAAPPGSTIGVVTPGSPPESRAEVQRGTAWWESQGYRVKLMPGALEQDGWHGGSTETRAADLQAAFADPEVAAIQTMRGGYGSAQVIPLLDFDAFADTTAPRSKTLEDVLDDRLGHLGVPVLYGLPLHGASLATLPLGVRATVDADALTLTIDEPALTVS